MPISRENLNAPRRGFYARRISARQKRQLDKMAGELTCEITILRLKVKVLLDQLEGLTFYTDLDLNRLGMVVTLVNSIGRLVQRNLLLTHKDLDVSMLIEASLREDAGLGDAGLGKAAGQWEQA
ncbi:MAG: hypothetical protein A2X25_06845 [Chloroflexi bacterium GWB2_49_20]|nr:MAG: hypothetical protein A2X25_06845 [Chloroflexi bacterium GWB2_49_20]OGN79089.1 MAG: hypothetical protein A2X26_09215 [Chloroflexi bacterium GWC2_49_37]HCC78010.1 hypothetical protein [Anaerolineae bacterium]HCM96637.1 hypothetical protein [Anaerolineae bacterium]